jgi:hypothetical protein
LVWTIIHTVTLNAMWVAWCSHTHERDVFAHSAVMAKVKKALTIRLQELWNRAKRLTRESPHLIPTPIDSFRITWCTGMITITHCNKLKIDYAHKRPSERRNDHHRQTPPAQNNFAHDHTNRAPHSASTHLGNNNGDFVNGGDLGTF